jgi:hypothetical protein
MGNDRVLGDHRQDDMRGVALLEIDSVSALTRPRNEGIAQFQD